MQEGSSTEHRIKSLNTSLQYLVYEYVCRSLFKADRLMFALHMVHGMYPEIFKENVSLTYLYMWQCTIFFTQYKPSSLQINPLFCRNGKRSVEPL